MGAAHESVQKLKDLHKAEVSRNDIAGIRGKNSDLAEQVENGKISMDEALEKIAVDGARNW